MEEAPVDPLDVSNEVSKDAELIKEAQREIAVIDILVCGACHDVFYFVEEFQKHKASEECTRVANLKCEREEKPQIWGFTLWKTKRVRELKEKDEELPTSWQLYEKWTALPQLQKDSWISAGQALQQSYKLSNAKVQEVKQEADKDPLALDDLTSEIASGKRAVRSNEKEEFNVEKILNKRFNARKRIWEYQIKWENFAELTWEPLGHLENCQILVTEFDEKLRLEKLRLKAEKIPSGKSRGRPRVTVSNADGSSPVKIVSKKTGLDSSAILETSIGERPQRSSKQRALNQVKAWIGNIAEDESGLSLKRTLEEGDSDDSFEKKMKMEVEDSDSEAEVDIRRVSGQPAKKIAKIVHSYSNGVGSRKLPDNVLIPDAKGVVRISQKQLPALSSGVYIMSKSSGIIKLDPTASKIATSGGQAIVKVSPKIGQTQIKIIKKDGSATPGKSPLVKTTASTLSGTPKIVQQVSKSSPTLKKVVSNDKITKKSTEPSKPQPKSITQQLLEKEIDEESDDGLEPLEFPTDLPLPEPDSPPGEFVLDPETGKVAGVEYPDPEPEPIIYEPKDLKDNSSTESIDNIVKLAAADITEDDLKPTAEITPKEEEKDESSKDPLKEVPKETKGIQEPAKKLAQLGVSLTEVTATSVTPKATSTPKTNVKPGQSVLNAAQNKKTIVSSKGQSILNTALTNSNILQKTLQSPRSTTGKTQTPQPRIINQSVVPKARPTIAPVIRTVNKPSTVIRTKTQVAVPKTKVKVGTPYIYHRTTPVSLGSTPHRQVDQNRQLYTKTKIAQKIGNTTVYKTVRKEMSPKTPKLIPATVAIASSSATGAVISMPSLEDEAPVVVATVAEPTSTTASTIQSELSAFTLEAGDRPMFITGDDGTVYQVAGQNEEGQTILLTQDSDGQQQCLLVTNEPMQEVQQVVAETEPQQQEEAAEMVMEVAQDATSALTVNTDVGDLVTQDESGDEQPLVAQFIRTEPPSPGGTHKVVVMLPDGNVMMTQVTPEEYATLALDK